MATALSPHMRTEIYNLLRRRPVYASLHTQNPGDSGRFEVTGGGYERRQLDWATDSEQLVNSGDIDFKDMPPLTVTAVGIWDAALGGNFLWGGDTTPRTTNAGDTYQVPDESLIVSVL